MRPTGRARIPPVAGRGRRSERAGFCPGRELSTGRSALLRSFPGDPVARLQSREGVAALECRRSTRVLCRVRLRRRLEAGGCPFDSALVEEIRKGVAKDEWKYCDEEVVAAAAMWGGCRG